MKKKSILNFALGALVAGMFSGCASDEPNNNVVENDEVRYLRVNIVNAFSESRATSFEDGTDPENTIESMRMDFYDQTGKFITTANPSDIEWKEPENSDNVEKVATAIVKIGLNKNVNLPAYIMCYLNPVSFSDGQIDNMTELRFQERSDYKNANSKFAMNNSCYFGKDDVTSTTDVKISGTPVNQKAIYTSMAAADTGTATVDIYVERYASKVKFGLNTTAASGTFPQDGNKAAGIYPVTGSSPAVYSLQFMPEAWTINAEANTMYAVKNFAVTADKKAPVPTKSDVQTYLGSWTSWNDDTRRRSYWSCSPAYFATAFPQVADDITDQTGGEAGKVVGDYKLKYYSYDQITANGVKKFSADAGSTVLPHSYAMENTVGKLALGSVNPKAAVPSVVVVGKYTVTYDGNPVEMKDRTFYIYNSELYFDNINNIKGATKNIKDAFVEAQQILYVKGTDNAGKETYTKVSSSNTEIYNNIVVKHPDKNVRGASRVSENYVTLQLSAVPTGVTNLYFTDALGRYVQVTSTNLDATNTQLWQQTGVATAYTNGMAYFSIPVHHLRITEDLVANEDDKPIKDGVLNWEKLRVGDLGLVRNHVYQLEVSAIHGLGSGILTSTAPIVPPMDVTEYFIKYKINILKWRIVPTQNGIIL